MASQQIVISTIKFNTTFVHTIQNVAFGNLPLEVCVSILKDHDFEVDGVDGGENLQFDQKTFTAGGCNFMPSNMIGQGRKFDQKAFDEKTNKLLYIIISNINFPEIKIKFVRGIDLVIDYPKGKIPFKDFDKFFGSTTNSNSSSNPQEYH
jgi:hypothetical protein